MAEETCELTAPHPVWGGQPREGERRKRTRSRVPALTILSDALIAVGGWLGAVLVLDVGTTYYLQQFRESLALRDVFVGLMKSVLFAITIAIISADEGLSVGRRVGAIGAAATRAVAARSNEAAEAHLERGLRLARAIGFDAALARLSLVVAPAVALAARVETSDARYSGEPWRSPLRPYARSELTASETLSSRRRCVTRWSTISVERPSVRPCTTSSSRP